MFVAISTLLGSCSEQADDLDTQLFETLDKASSGVGVSSFILPASNDFNSIPQDPGNPLTDAKVNLGGMLFHETALGINPKKMICFKTYSCASCHHAPAGFQAGTKQGIGDGAIGFGFHGEGRAPLSDYMTTELDVQPIRTPSSMNIAYQTNILWNGQFGATDMNVGTEASWTAGTPKEKNFLGFEGVETQAIAAMDVHRLGIDSSFFMNSAYKHMFDFAFPDVPESERYSIVNIGLAVAAYERTVLANKAPFQQWLKGKKTALSEQEKRGAILFFGKAGCSDCHNGPALNSMAFYGLGMDNLDGPGIYGNSPEKLENFGRGGFTNNEADMHKFKVPQLYNLKDSPFYGHGGNFTTIKSVVEYINNAVPENPLVPASQLAPQFKPLNLTDSEVDDIVAFLSEGLYDPDLNRYTPVALPSGYCFPNNDTQSQIDMGCIQ